MTDGLCSFHGTGFFVSSTQKRLSFLSISTETISGIPAEKDLSFEK